MSRIPQNAVWRCSPDSPMCRPASILSVISNRNRSPPTVRATSQTTTTASSRNKSHSPQGRLPSSRCIRSAPRHWWGLSRLVVWALQTALRLHGTDQKWHLSNELYTVLAKCCLHNVWHCLAETSARRAGLHRFRTTSPWRARSRNICAVPSDSVSTSTPSLPMGTALWTGKASPYRINSSVR